MQAIYTPGVGPCNCDEVLTTLPDPPFPPVDFDFYGFRLQVGRTSIDIDTLADLLEAVQEGGTSARYFAVCFRPARYRAYGRHHEVRVFLETELFEGRTWGRWEE